MGKIVILDENTSNKIAAGEVIERPSSVVKELVENSLDAGATSIIVEIKNGGVSYIKIMDNGTGMEEDDVGIAFERHATSKIRYADDIENITSMGFRGEALASIAAVSVIRLVTRTSNKTQGTAIDIRGGEIIDIKPAGCPVGTTIIVQELFFNTPARYKFLKKDAAEAGHISDIIGRLALANPNVAFKLINNGAVSIQTPGNNDRLSSIFSIYGKEVSKAVHEVGYETSLAKITGFIGKPEIARSNRNYQSIFINRRYIRSKTIAAAIDEAYNTYLMKNKYAFAVLNLEINPATVDINVHPSKMEVKFSNEQEIFKAVYNAIINVLHAGSEIRNANTADSVKNPFVLNNVPLKAKETSYIQESILRKTEIPVNEVQVKPVSVESINTAIDCQNRLDTNNSDKYNKAFEDTEKYEVNNLEALLKQTAIPIDAVVIGQAFNTYVILQLEDQLVLLDQHAAHERIIFEKIKSDYDKRVDLPQTLLSGYVIELSPKEAHIAEAETDFFERLGFHYDEFGSNSIIIRSAPLIDSTKIKETFLELIDFLMENGTQQRTTIEREAIYRLACKSAVKANKHLDTLEIRNLLEGLYKLDNPFTCPHGRPTVIKISRYELEKMFKRIV